MELFLYLIISVVVYILFVRISYKLWVLFFDTIFKTFNDRMKIASIILGILWPIGLPLLLIVAIIYAFTNKNK